MAHQENPVWSKYQEKEHWSDYEEARERVCSIYNVDPTTAHVHHIIDRYTVLHDPIFEDMDLNELSNLYPFTEEDRDGMHTTKQDHKDLHQTIGRRQYERRKEAGEW